ncbi:uncharacterized protein [Spinacia oleracea]|uniref:Transmembrane protein n=1 Tax=Spinacia oleracea TaxID=3562 RepID=A0A9R0JUY5_SPIOL|nr:uncharacterized protein LOC110787662 [Spinacia oleracea]
MATSYLLPLSPPIHHYNNSNKHNFLFTSTQQPKLLHHHYFQSNSKNNKSSPYQPLISRYLTLSKHKKPRNFKVSAASSEDAAAVIPSETTQEIVSAATSVGDGVSAVISILLFIAFLALSILTIGVVYIAVTDFLTKREKEKFEKEEEAKKKKGGKKGKVKARAGPRGFGQKIDEFEDDNF